MDRSGLEKVARPEWIKAVYFSPFRQIELREEKPRYSLVRAGKRGRMPRIRETFVTTWGIVARPLAYTRSSRGTAQLNSSRNTSSNVRSQLKRRFTAAQ